MIDRKTSLRHFHCALGVSTLSRVTQRYRAETSGGSALMNREKESPLVSLSECITRDKVVRHPTGRASPNMAAPRRFASSEQTGMLDERRSVAQAPPPRISLWETLHP